MRIGPMNIPSLGQFQRDTRLLLISSAILSLGFFGLQSLLKVLYILRLGFGLEYVGLFTAMGALTYMAMSLPSGALGLRYGMKPVMLFGGVLTTVGMFILPLSEFVPRPAMGALPILSQMVMTSGWAMLSINAVPALMAATTSKTRDDAFALYSMLRGAGTFAGTMIGGLLPMLFASMLAQNLDSAAPYRWALIVGALTGVVGLIPLFRVHNVEGEVVEDETVQNGPFPVAFVVMVLLHVFLIHGGSGTVNAFGNAYMDTDLKLSAAAIGFITGAGQFVAILAPIMMPVLAARRSNAWTLMMASLLTALCIIPIAYVPTWYAIGIGRLGIIAIAAIWMPALQAFQMNVVERHWRSLAYGAVSTGMGFSFGIVSLVGGFIAASYGYSLLFSIGIVMCAAGGAVMWSMRKLPAYRKLMEPRTQSDAALVTPAVAPMVPKP